MSPAAARVRAVSPGFFLRCNIRGGWPVILLEDVRGLTEGFPFRGRFLSVAAST